MHHSCELDAVHDPKWCKNRDGSVDYEKVEKSLLQVNK
jgi:hypothetical protein